MSKYAIIVIASYNYLKGINALLNAIDYYENKVDVYYLHCSTTGNYANYVKDKFTYNIYPIPVKDIGDSSFSENSNCIWAKYNMALQIKDKYDTIMFIDADCCILNNITPYFEFASSTNYILVPKNPHSDIRLEDYISYRGKEEEIHKGYPVLNFCWFTNPKKHEDLIQFVWNKREDYNPSNEPIRFCQGLFELNKFANTLQLPGSIWIGDHTLHKWPTYVDRHSKIRLHNPVGDRIEVLHSRFWSNAVSNHELEGVSPNTVAHENAHITIQSHQTIFDFLNNNLTVTLSEIEREFPNHAYLLRV